MSKKFEKLHIGFGKKMGSRKDKTWNTGSLLKNQSAKRILTGQPLAQRKGEKLTRLKLTPAGAGNRNNMYVKSSVEADTYR
ncbi:hypothetical protein FBY04_1458 [Pseudomonas sp. SJZ080]|nr:MULTISPECIES: hypothetical protein [unclassified Pseudomonas]TWC11521.1 hypothetical protein FBY05_1389 [Pseudomonas sp. SJZ083]TWC40025.1 hypothetical protein FBY01_1387 [Pseudomonas sp. SJZ077]TWC44530.1 hypothetical protein FBY04_1458 [Pseudomonas sp. SJZ080]